MNVGLLYTPVSIPQMTWGALVLFVSIFSVVFLRRHLWLYKYISHSSLYFQTYLPLFQEWYRSSSLCAGVALVGYSGSLIKDTVEAITFLLTRALGNHNNDSLIHSSSSAGEPDLGKALVSKFSSRHLISKSNFKRLAPQGILPTLFAQVF